MSNTVKYDIQGDTNAEQVTERVKKSISTLEKNIQGVESKFKSFGKDLFLSFAAPMVLLNNAVSMISAAIEKSRQEVRDALAFAEKGESKYLREGTVTSAREVSRRKQDALDRKNAKLAAEALAKEQGQEGGLFGFGGEADKAGVQYMKESKGFTDYLRRNAKMSLMFFGLSDYAKDTEFQDVLERRSQARVASDPTLIAAAKQKEAAENQMNAQKALESKGKFDGAPGFSNIVGVGANPVLDAMVGQLEEQRKQTALLQQIVANGGYTPVDFTKTSASYEGYGDQM